MRLEIYGCENGKNIITKIMQYILFIYLSERASNLMDTAALGGHWFWLSLFIVYACGSFR